MLHLLLLNRLAQRLSLLNVTFAVREFNTALKNHTYSRSYKLPQRGMFTWGYCKGYKNRESQGNYIRRYSAEPVRASCEWIHVWPYQNSWKNYDYIIFDTPPIGVVIDALPIMKASDGVVIIARNNSTTYPELSRTVEVIKRTNAKFSVLFLTV